MRPRGIWSHAVSKNVFLTISLNTQTGNMYSPNKVLLAIMDFASSIAVRSTSRNTSLCRIRTLLLCFLGVQTLLYCGYAYAVDPPVNIRLENNRLLWDDVAGVSKYDIYLLSSAGLNANGTYPNTHSVRLVSTRL